MPAQRGQSVLTAKWGTKYDSSVAKHAKDETKYGPISLPPGITNGIAQITECYFDELKTGDNTGQPYFRAVGSILSPTYVETKDGRMKVRGLQTSIMKAMVSRKKQNGDMETVDDCIAWVLNEFRKLGADTSNYRGVRNLEQLATQIAQAKPYFRFSTSPRKATKDNPEPGIWENWNGNKGLEDYSPPEGDGENDETANLPVASANGKGVPHFDETANDEPSAENDLDVLLEQAEQGEQEAIDTLEKIGVEVGLDRDDILGPESGTWAEVVEKIRAAQGGGPTTDDEEQSSEEEEGEEEEGSDEVSWSPEAGQVYNYILRDPKTGQPARDPKTKKPLKPVEVTVMTVNKKNETATIKRNDTKAQIKDVSWQALESAE